MQTLVIAVAFATVAIAVLTEAGSASQAWYLPASKSMRATRHAVLIGLVGMTATLAALIVAESADAAGYSQRRPAAPTAYNTQANPNYGFGPRVRVHPHDVISGGRIIGRDPDPFIRGELLRHYHSGWPD
jgi:hypothetical protein